MGRIIISSTNNHSFISSFPILKLLLHLSLLSGASDAMFNSTGMGVLYLTSFLTFKEMCQSFSVKYYYLLFWGYTTFTKLKHNLHLLRVVFKVINSWWNLPNAFSASIEIIRWFFSFTLLMWLLILIYTDIYILILNYPYIPLEKKSTWSWHIIICCISFWIC